jgi:hypothetical protein
MNRNSRLMAVAIFASLVVSHASSRAAAPFHLWSRQIGGTDDDTGYDARMNAEGYRVVTGGFSSTVDFGGGPLTSAGQFDIYIAKYGPTGSHLWSKRLGSIESQIGASVALLASGAVVVTGNFFGTVDFGGGALTSAGGADIFLAMYDTDGSHLWSKQFGGTATDTGQRVQVDASGNVYLTGYFSGTVDFGGGPLTSGGGTDLIVAKFDVTGTHQWSRHYGSTSNEIGFDLALDASGNILVSGQFGGTVSFGGGALMSTGGLDIFVAKYDGSGVHQWSQHFGSTSTDIGDAVAVDGAGNVIVAGRFAGTVNFGGGAFTSAGGSDIFVAKYNAGGTHQWSQRFGSTSTDICRGAASDATGDVVVTGEFTGTVNFGGSALASAGGTDVFLARYNSAGTHEWSQHFGSTAGDQSRNVEVNAAGIQIATGQFVLTASFGGSSFTSAGFDDAFVAIFGNDPVTPVISSIVDVGNDQGRQVEIGFTKSGGIGIEQYEAYRRDDPLPVTATRPTTASTSRQQLLSQGWMFVGAVPETLLNTYEMTVATLADSTISNGPHESVFFIRAATYVPWVYYDSPPDSGDSLDNLAPGIPTNIAISSGVLSWDESGDADFDFFSVYGAGTASFASATLIDYTVMPAMDVTASPYAYYFVTATDFSGNEGTPAMLTTPTDVFNSPKGYALSISAYPNPFNPQTTIRYTVPSKGQVTIAVYDLRGAFVVTLVDENQEVGAYTKTWDGKDAGGVTISSGVYFARVTHPSGTRSYKLVLLK